MELGLSGRAIHWAGRGSHRKWITYAGACTGASDVGGIEKLRVGGSVAAEAEPRQDSSQRHWWEGGGSSLLECSMVIATEEPFPSVRKAFCSAFSLVPVSKEF